MSVNGDAGPQPGRIVLITGANRGLGRETASQLARLGRCVLIAPGLLSGRACSGPEWLLHSVTVEAWPIR
jgi:hypothetical protein